MFRGPCNIWLCFRDGFKTSNYSCFQAQFNIRIPLVQQKQSQCQAVRSRLRLAGEGDEESWEGWGPQLPTSRNCASNYIGLWSAAAVYNDPMRGEGWGRMEVQVSMAVGMGWKTFAVRAKDIS